jgi:hypothetical protein
LGRSKIEGNEICPKCENLGRYRSVPSRNGEYKNARTREYRRFMHNDRTLKDCHGIENALRERELEKIRNGPSPVLEEQLFLLAEDIKDFGITFKKVAERVNETNIDPKDDKKYALMFKEGARYHIDTMIAFKKYLYLVTKPNKTPADLQAINKFNNIMDDIEK